MRVLTLDNPRSLPFVLSFTNLTYSIKICRKFSLSGMFTGQSNRLSAARLSEPVGGESLSTRTKTLLNDISSEAREGEMLAVLGASGSGKSTLIDETEESEFSPLGRIEKVHLPEIFDQVLSCSKFTS